MTEQLMLTEEDELLELLNQGGADALDLLSGHLPIIGTQSMETIDALLQSLSEEEFEVVDKYFGLSGEGPYTAEEIGDVLGLDETEVTAIIAQAMRQLRGAS
jgi:DNA-directed RNA polymerase sigma subunit (sigma70/sigma32)